MHRLLLVQLLGAATVGGSLFVAATVAPAQTLSLAGAATLCAVAGQRVADGKAAIPGTGKKEEAPSASTKKSDSKPAAESETASA